MSIISINGLTAQNLSKDTSQGQAIYQDGDYDRVVSVVGSSGISDGADQGGFIDGVYRRFLLVGFDANNIPEINVLAAFADPTGQIGSTFVIGTSALG